MKHRTKLKIAIAIIFLIFTSTTFATGAGVIAGVKPGFFINEDGNSSSGIMTTVSGSFHVSRIPLVVGLGVELGKPQNFNNIADQMLIGVSGFVDYWIIDYQIKNTSNFIAGFGLTLGLLTPDIKDWNLYMGARFFAGFTWLFFDNYIEVFAQQNFIPTYHKNLKTAESPYAMNLGLPFEFGVRLHF